MEKNLKILQCVAFNLRRRCRLSFKVHIKLVRPRYYLFLISSVLHIACIALLLCTTPTLQASETPSIRLCQDSENVYPWTLQNRPGLNNILLDMVERKMGITFVVASDSWKRCQKSLKEGLVDGMFAISYESERLEYAVYPLRGAEPDNTKNLMIDGYSLYRRRGDVGVNWDGKVLTANGLIGAQQGYSVSKQLQNLNATVDAEAHAVENNLRKLVAGRLVAVALRTSEGDSVIATHREFNGKVEKLPIPLIEKPYYLVFSKQFAFAHHQQVQDLWDMVENVRNSPEYTVFEASFR